MRLKNLTFLLFLLAPFCFTACCSCGGGEDNIVKGIITIVGNEPFSKLAIKLEDDKNYLLICSEELKKELWNQQGNYYAVQFTERKMEEGVTAFVVEKVTPLNQNINK